MMSPKAHVILSVTAVTLVISVVTIITIIQCIAIIKNKEAMKKELYGKSDLVCRLANDYRTATPPTSILGSVGTVTCPCDHLYSVTTCIQRPVPKMAIPYTSTSIKRPPPFKDHFQTWSSLNAGFHIDYVAGIRNTRMRNGCHSLL
jgi:hypothetical protein